MLSIQGWTYRRRKWPLAVCDAASLFCYSQGETINSFNWLNAILHMRKLLNRWLDHVWMVQHHPGIAVVPFLFYSFSRCKSPGNTKMFVKWLLIPLSAAFMFYLKRIHSFTRACVQEKKIHKTLRQATVNILYMFPHFTKKIFSSFSSWMQSLREIVRILGLFAVIIYSFKVIIRQHRRNVRSSAPLLPSHQRVIITILLLLSSSLTGWPALKYTLNHLQACTKWPTGSLLSVIKRRNSQWGGHRRPLAQSCLST